MTTQELLKDILGIKEDLDDPFTFEVTLDSIPKPKDNNPYIYNSEQSPNYLYDGYKMTLYSSKLVNMTVEKDVILYLTNIRTFQHEQTKQYQRRTSEAISDTRDRLKGKPFKIRKSPSSFCRKYRVGLYKTEKSQLKTATFKPMPCMSWTCPSCSPYKALRIKYELIEIIMSNNLEYFLTLTLDPSKLEKHNREDTHKYITKLFNHFITVLKRKSFTYFDKNKKRWFTFDLSKQEEKLKYVWICEFQKNGNAHLHILLNQFLPVDIIREIWVHVGGGHIMYIDKVKNQSAISMYLTHYIVKGLKDAESQGGFKFFQRRYSVSRSCVRNKNNALPLLPSQKLPAQHVIRILEYMELGWSRPYLYNVSKDEFHLNFDPTKKDV